MTVDLGVRCPRHDLEVFLPRCDACLAMTAEWRALTHGSGERYPEVDHATS